MQIIIVCPDQCIAEIPRVFTERIVIDAESKGFHIFNHKHGGGTGQQFPSIREEMLYREIWNAPVCACSQGKFAERIGNGGR